jgi:hypothetical protein
MIESSSSLASRAGAIGRIDQHADRIAGEYLAARPFLASGAIAEQSAFGSISLPFGSAA